MRLLAIDEGSHATGLAFFDGTDRPAWTRSLLPGDGPAWPWRRRMRWIGDALRGALDMNGLLTEPPDAIAMEDAVVGAYPSTALKVAECRGYLTAHLDSIYGLELRHVTISPAKARAAVGLGAYSSRARSKDRYRTVATYLGLPETVSEDECDAAAIGLAALAQLRAESWRAAAS